jgi:hypothetical protein
MRRLSLHRSWLRRTCYRTQSSIASTFLSDRIHNTKKASEKNPFDKPPLAYAGWVGSNARFLGSERLKTSRNRVPNISPIQDSMLCLLRFVMIALSKGSGRFLGGFMMLSFVPRCVPVGGFTGGADLRSPRSTRKPCLAASFAFLQCDYFHVLTLRIRRRDVVVRKQPAGCPRATC